METVRGSKITIIFDGKKCIHSRHCVTGAPKTFLANVDGPWIHPDDTSTEHLVEVAHLCPSGAIAYERHDGGPQEQAPEVNVARVRENGPVAINAPLSLDGVRIGFRATLCRCGASKNKPFCDGSHHDVSFVASGEPDTRKADALAIRDGEVKLAPQKNGPLMVEGNLEICSGTGRIVERTTKTWLCRCGRSANKPFCDGTHNRIGFQAD